MIWQPVFRDGPHNNTLPQQIIEHIGTGSTTVKGNEITDRRNKRITLSSEPLCDLSHAVLIQCSTPLHIVVVSYRRQTSRHGQTINIKRLPRAVE